ncbi:hypothetical protein [Caulobacter endophyticus]|uniref:Uncharacterized protein n=1 Tax=Caulobacter endophyticus TaxID=2172652 RepID=A0A2T9JQQ5_9CAUL|nr:hypothetical protein [Caulobacter endophyticus]PVM85931.1 hypothetical protein DDF67_17210 [Caulobacter endophyticus]
MLDLLWTLRGSVPLASTTANQTVIDRVTALLERQEQQPELAAGGRVTFKVPLLTKRRYFRDATAVFDQGWFRVEHGLDGRVLRYELRGLHSLWRFLLFAGITAVGSFRVGGATRDEIPEMFGMSALGYGAIVLLASARTIRLLREVAQGR